MGVWLSERLITPFCTTTSEPSITLVARFVLTAPLTLTKDGNTFRASSTRTAGNCPVYLPDPSRTVVLPSSPGLQARPKRPSKLNGCGFRALCSELGRRAERTFTNGAQSLAAGHSCSADSNIDLPLNAC